MSEIQSSPLHQAAKNNDAVVIKRLLDEGADKDARDGDGFTPLHVAGEHNSAAVAQVLLEAGADKEARGGRGTTPLHSAAAANSVDVVQLLLDAGADKDAMSETGLTPLHSTAFSNAGDVARLLLAAGVRTDILASGDTVIDTCLWIWPAPAVLEALVEAGVPIVVEDGPPEVQQVLAGLVQLSLTRKRKMEQQELRHQQEMQQMRQDMEQNKCECQQLLLEVAAADADRRANKPVRS